MDKSDKSMRALLEGIRLLRILGLTEVDFEIDSTAICKAAREEGNNANLIYNCRKNNLGRLNLCKIKKSQNRIANTIAQLNWYHQKTFTGMVELPARIQQLIRLEYLN
ncbi:hypothetical protein CASFOL_006241 [Castilleja foliolosa]|uniref:RNase H type-1 domain-containing protein n=1 Tax=Castilleja foliolosa TaxID=1961234 RepID=A0ABD3E5T1_9LAMI